jgi:hypothetical protein
VEHRVSAVFSALAFCLVGHVAQAWRTLRADLAENITGPPSFTWPFLTDPMSPASKCEHRANPVLQKNATPNHSKDNSIGTPSLIRAARPL